MNRSIEKQVRHTNSSSVCMSTIINHLSHRTAKAKLKNICTQMNKNNTTRNNSMYRKWQMEWRNLQKVPTSVS